MSTGTLFQNLATGVLCVCAVVVTVLVVRRETLPAGSDSEREVQNWNELTVGASLIGDPTAPIKVILFSDFQCPACARAMDALAELRRRHGDNFAIFYRHYPLSNIHPHAIDAAIAAECARDQGRFPEYHDLLFEHQRAIGLTPWDSLAVQAGVSDLRRFTICLSAPASEARIMRDLTIGDSLGVGAVPTLIVQGMMSSGSTGIRRLEQGLLELQ